MADPNVDVVNAPFVMFESMGVPRPRSPLRPISARVNDYPAMPPYVPQTIRTMTDFARFFDADEGPFSSEDPRSRSFCSMARSIALNGTLEAYANRNWMPARPEQNLPTWILDEQLIPHQVSPVEAARWFTEQLVRNDIENLITLAATLFTDGSVDTHFTGQPHGLWETSSFDGSDYRTYRSHTLDQADEFHRGEVLRIMKLTGEEPTSEHRRREAVALHN